MESTSTPNAGPSKQATTALKTWFNMHRQFPYPLETEKAGLQEETGLTSTQVSDWFTNARRRNKARRSSAPVQSGSSHSSALESQGASLSGIAAVTSTQEDSSFVDFPFLEECASQGSWSAQSDWMSAGYGSPMSFNSEHNSSGLVDSFNSRRRRKRRSTVTEVPKSAKNRNYQCTFCTDRFRTKWDWTRHESAQHISFERWVCAPFGPFESSSSSMRCAFCDVENPSDAHLETHRYSDCLSMSAACRTFCRKDHLQQHLAHFHGLTSSPASIDQWHSRQMQVNCRCGFCGETFDEWSRRNDHLADHFRKGWSMTSWTGDHGLDPDVAMCVRNGMPLYLIGMDLNGIAGKFVPEYGQSTNGEQFSWSQMAPNNEDSLQTLSPDLGLGVPGQAASPYISDERPQNAATLTAEQLSWIWQTPGPSAPSSQPQREFANVEEEECRTAELRAMSVEDILADSELAASMKMNEQDLVSCGLVSF